MRRIPRLLFVALWSVLLSGCVVPVVYGPHYRPVYPDAERVGTPTLSSTLGPIASPFQNPEAIEQKVRQGAKPLKQDVWRYGKAGTRLGIKLDDCYIRAYAEDEDGRFILDWIVEQSSRCSHHLAVDNTMPVALEDMETGRKYDVRIFQRLFLGSEPGLSVDEPVDLAAKLPGYREVPVAERQYTVSLNFKRGFNGKLPDQLTIQLPPLWIGSHRIQLPPLAMQRHGNVLSRFSDYEPRILRILPNYGALDKVWYEQDGEISLTSTFSGWDDGKKWGDFYASGILGQIDIQVSSGLPIRFEHAYATWQEGPGDGKPIQMPLKRYNLVKYTTTRFDDPLASVFWGHDPAEGYRGQGKPFDAPLPEPKPMEPFKDDQVHAIVLVPDFKPKRVRVTLPRILVDGEVWPVQPIEFDYRSGSAELIDAM